jgi:hypothetical protein
MGTQQSVSAEGNFKILGAWTGVNLFPMGVIVSYLQPVHSNFVMGGSLITTEDQNILIGGSRYDDGTNFVIHTMQTTGMNKITLTKGLAHTIYYGRKVSADVTMLSMLMCYPEQLNSRFAVGAKYEPKKNERSFRVAVDSDGVVSTAMETTVKIGNFGFRLGMGSKMNHAKNEYHTGVTVSMGG